MSFSKNIKYMPSSKLYLHLLIVKLLYVIEGGRVYALIENGIRGNRISFMIMCRIADALELSLDYISIKEKEYQAGINNGDY